MYMGLNFVRQTEIHTAEPLVPEPSAFEVDLVIEKLKSNKSPGIDQIQAELIKAGVRQFAVRYINLLFLFGIGRNCLRSGRSRSLYLSIRRVIKQIVVIVEAYHFCQLCTRLTPYAEEIIGDHQCGFRHNRSTTDHIFFIRQILGKKCEYNEAVHHLFIDFKKAYDSFRREVLYNILIEFGIPMKLVRLIKMCLSETCSRVQVGKNLSDMFPFRNGLK